jgi:Flp pilus assembly protein TadG
LLFRAHQGGHALLETALLFTFLPFLFLGVSEFSEADMITRRVDEAAGKSADLIARLDSVTTGELDALKDNLINELMKPYPTGGFGLTLTSVVTDQDGRSTVSWSHARGGTVAARPVGSDVLLPAGLAEPSTSVIMAESASSFSSTFGTMIVGSRTMTGVSYSAPRRGGQVVMMP